MVKYKNKMKYLLTYEDALKLVNKYDNFNFSKSEYTIDGYKIITFKYFLCEFSLFDRPLSNDLEINGYDMRGTTFIFNKDGSLWKRYFMLPKFFNLDQVETTQYHLVKDKKIKSIADKADGSLVSFMKLPNGNTFAKTIAGFSNEQVAESMKLYNTDGVLRDFIEDMLELNMTPLFEFVSIFNRIVLIYKKTELKFIGARNNVTGDFIPACRIETKFDISRVANVMKDGDTLDSMIKLAKTEKDIEGWVIEFDDGQLIKIKCEWYFNLHGIRTENIFREDYVIKNYLELKLDDIIGQLDKDFDKDSFEFIDRAKLAVNKFIKHIDKKVKTLVDEYYDEFNEDWVKFATEKHKYPFFNLIKSKIENPELYNSRRSDYIISKTKRLNKAKLFVDHWSGTKNDIINQWNKNNK